MQDIKPRYNMTVEGHAHAIDGVEDAVKRYHPDLLVVASVWTPTESNRIQQIVRNTDPNVRIFALPHRILDDKGPDALAAFARDNLPKVLG